MFSVILGPFFVGSIVKKVATMLWLVVLVRMQTSDSFEMNLWKSVYPETLESEEEAGSVRTVLFCVINHYTQCPQRCDSSFL